MDAAFRERIEKYPWLGTFEERRERQHGADDIGEFGPDEPDRIKQMRNGGDKDAGRRFVDIMAEDDAPWLLNQTKKDSLGTIYDILAERYEDSYHDFLE